jgi:hypothetical protein
VLGLIALLLLAGIAARNVMRHQTPAGRAAAAAFLTWSVLYMLVMAMRISAPAWAFGIASALILPAARSVPRGAGPRRKAGAAPGDRKPRPCAEPRKGRRMEEGMSTA